MQTVKTERGFTVLMHPKYPNGDHKGRLVQESSAIGDYEDAFDKPGSSFLWFGEHHHLSREEVRELVAHLQHWLETGRLELDAENPNA